MGHELPGSQGSGGKGREYRGEVGVSHSMRLIVRVCDEPFVRNPLKDRE